MAISVEQIDEWRSFPSEKEVLEFKEAKNQYDTEKLFGYCVAIANEGGGHMILGIQDKPPRRVTGTKAIDNPNGMAGKILDKLGFRVHIEVVNHPDGRVVVLIIPRRPQGHPYQLEGAFLMRCGESLRAMTVDQLRRIVLEGEPEWLREPSVSGYKIGPAKILQLLDTTLLCKLLGIPYPSMVEVIDRLKNEQLIIDEGAGSYSITNMGALLLAKELSSFPEMELKAPRVVVYRGKTKLTQPLTDAPGTMGYAVGFQGLLGYVNDHLPHEEVIENGLRREVALIPEIIVRELLANALVHQDFTLHGNSVLVEIFEDRIEVSNPDEPIVPVDRLIDGICSRNERLADFMRRIGICERRGSGIDRIVDAAEILHLPAPDFRAMDKRTLAIAFGPRQFGELGREDRIRACYQHCVLKWVNAQPMTNQSLRQRFKVPEKKSYLVTQVITTAIEKKAIKPDEKAGKSRKFARYVPIWV